MDTKQLLSHHLEDASNMCKSIQAKRTTLASDYIVLDIETTGLDPIHDEIIEIGAIRIRDYVVRDSFASLIKPQTPISDFIEHFTGITNSAVETAPSIQDVLPVFIDYIGEETIIGHNIKFDISFLSNAGLKYLGKAILNDYIDTLQLCRELYPNWPHHRLIDMEDKFQLHNEHPHRALSDVILTNECYLHMIHQIKHQVSCD